MSPTSTQAQSVSPPVCVGLSRQAETPVPSPLCPRPLTPGPPPVYLVPASLRFLDSQHTGRPQPRLFWLLHPAPCWDKAIPWRGFGLWRRVTVGTLTEICHTGRKKQMGTVAWASPAHAAASMPPVGLGHTYGRRQIPTRSMEECSWWCGWGVRCKPGV